MSDPHEQDQSSPETSVVGQDDAVNGAEATPEPGLISGRTASVRFDRRSTSAHTNNRARMDAANQSLADALKITYVFLQFGMVVLVVLFFFSGVQRINEGERGIKVFLGKPTQTWKSSAVCTVSDRVCTIGEMIRVGAGAVEIPMARDFMPTRPGSMSDDELLNADFGGFNSSGRLNPSADSMILTADQNIAHAQFRVNYHRSDHREYVENIRPQDE
ncbi:MAG TPA: hypothetical protein EYO33_29335, partial [Phycisphaerales bacterium]|nr:hypothetical protein [Phycisphaerales bacterium]